MDDPLNGRDLSALGSLSVSGTSRGAEESEKSSVVEEQGSSGTVVAEEVLGVVEMDEFCLEKGDFPVLPGKVVDPAKTTGDTRGSSSFVGGLNVSWGKAASVADKKVLCPALGGAAVPVGRAGSSGGGAGQERTHSSEVKEVGHAAGRPQRTAAKSAREDGIFGRHGIIDMSAFPPLPNQGCRGTTTSIDRGSGGGPATSIVVPESKSRTLGHATSFPGLLSTRGPGATGSKARDGWDDSGDDDQNTLTPSLPASPALQSVGTGTSSDPEREQASAESDDVSSSSWEELYVVEERPPPYPVATSRHGEAARSDIPPRSSVPRRKNDAQSKEAPATGTGTPPARPVNDHIRNAPWRKPREGGQAVERKKNEPEKETRKSKP